MNGGSHMNADSGSVVFDVSKCSMGVPLLVCASHTAAIVRIGGYNVRIGMGLNYSGGFAETVEEVGDLEKAGLDIAFVPEAYSFDAVSQLGYLAAKTSTIELASGIFQIYTRTPSLTAMTAAGLDFVSNGRFVMGLGASGPQVIEGGFHGVKYDAPLGRTREVVEICRQVWRREKVEYQGKYYQVPPLPRREGHRTRKAAQADQSSCA